LEDSPYPLWGEGMSLGQNNIKEGIEKEWIEKEEKVKEKGRQKKEKKDN
jgi:hypothetical protein